VAYLTERFHRLMIGVVERDAAPEVHDAPPLVTGDGVVGSTTMQLTSDCAPGIPGDAPIRTEAVIVGAGPAGLAVAACLRRARIPFVVLERGDRIAVSWHRHYERLHLHTAKTFSGLPYFAFPHHYPRYPSRLQVIDYLEAYAAHFDIRPHFSEQVVAAKRVAGEWCIATERASYVASNLVIATGYNSRPYQPTWPGQPQFDGHIVHSSEYRNGEPYRGKRVLVVGFGNSGGEIAIDLWEHGARSIVLAVRGPVNVIPRDIFGIPAMAFAIAQRRLPPRMADALNAPLVHRRFGDLARYGVRQAADGPITQITKHARIPVIDVGIVQLIRTRAVTIRPGITEFSARGVRFADGSEEAFDAVILATGYHPAIDAFLADASTVTDERGIPRVSGYATAVPGLYVCGFSIVPTGMLREIGIEAKGIARTLSRPLVTRTVAVHDRR
jgi:cation diffusion facilitator CzcD-associated flavoprotein CzcO